MATRVGLLRMVDDVHVDREERRLQNPDDDLDDREPTPDGWFTSVMDFVLDIEPCDPVRIWHPIGSRYVGAAAHSGNVLSCGHAGVRNT